MKKALVLTLVFLLSISLIGCAAARLNPGEEIQKLDPENPNNDEAQITSVVENFGQKLQSVSLLAPEDVLKKSMQENYGEFVSPALIEQWLKDPINAPGRLTSSPWPDRIEILSIEKISEKAYEVKGEIIEITSADNNEIAAKRPIILEVAETGGKWLVNNANIGE